MLVGVIYGLVNVRSPAPPVIALIGLLGILVARRSLRWSRHSGTKKPLRRLGPIRFGRTSLVASPVGKCQRRGL
ncbi:MAG TPA: DUF1427 family protein [Acetobacteraceae bacterium]|nr:DUF1427 family protein [Acetobacteraceae bacterium]